MSVQRGIPCLFLLVTAIVVFILLLMVINLGGWVHFIDGSGVFIRFAYCLPTADCSGPLLQLARMWAWQYGISP